MLLPGLARFGSERRRRRRRRKKKKLFHSLAPLVLVGAPHRPDEEASHDGLVLRQGLGLEEVADLLVDEQPLRGEREFVCFFETRSGLRKASESGHFCSQ